jgi:hypothetical protein
VNLLIHKESLSAKFNLPVEDMIRRTPIGSNVAINVMLPPRLPFEEPIECTVIAKIKIFLEIDWTCVALDAEGAVK